MGRLLAKLRQAFHLARGRSVEFDLSAYQKTLDHINRFDFGGAQDSQLQATSADIVSQARKGVPADRLLPQSFALVREAADRVLGLRPFDVQVMAAIAMHQGNLAEMQTGEGKTLTAVMPAYLNALTGRGVHVLTFNDYLATRDAEWMGALFRFLGLTVGSVQQGISAPQRVDEYSKDMAGRGTDIRLGGDESPARDKIVALGGLYVIGTNRHESRRIDDQLRGRAGRQSDPGESRFYISLEDDLIQRYGIRDLIPPNYRTLRGREPIDDTRVTRAIERAQRIIESQSFDIRRTLWRYASLIEEQRKEVHARRRAWLEDRPPESLLADRCTDRYAELLPVVGDSVLRTVERQITLAQIDRCWADYLAHIAELRENIHLMVLANQDPLDEFHKMAGREFATLNRRIDDDIVTAFLSATITSNGIDVESEGLQGPASTWTYLINDNPFGDVLQRLFKGLKRQLSSATDGSK